MRRSYAKPVIPWTIDPAVRAAVQVGVVEAERVRLAGDPEGLAEEIDALCRRLSAEHAGRSPSEIDGLAPARRLYRGFGIDPTSTRPSSEALLRRILQGKPFPRINPAVDVCNLCSTSFLLPIGLYDAAAIRGPVTLRRGEPGEAYTGIRKDRVHVGGRPVLSDADGAFGNPTSDSSRTSVSVATTWLWMVIFAPFGYSSPLLESHVEFARLRIERYLAP